MKLSTPLELTRHQIKLLINDGFSNIKDVSDDAIKTHAMDAECYILKFIESIKSELEKINVLIQSMGSHDEI